MNKTTQKNTLQSTLIGCILVVCMINSIHGQTIDSSYGGTGKDGLRNITALKDGGYLLAGWIDQTTKDHFGTGYLLNIDADGNQRWEKKLMTNGRNRITNVFEQKEGGFLAVVEEFPSKEEPGQVVLMELTRKGEVIKQYEFGDEGPDIIEIIRKTPDGGYAFVGESAMKVDGDYQAWVGKLSPDFALKWQHRLGSEGKDRLTDCRVLPDGSIIGVGYLMKPDENGKFYSQPWLLKLDPLGETIWSHEPLLANPGAIRGIALAEDGTLMLAGYTIHKDSRDFDAWVGAASPEGKILWYTILATPGFNNLMAVERLPDGNYIAIGSAKNVETAYDAIMVEFSMSGETIHSHTIKKPGKQFGRVVCPKDNNTIAIGGFNNQNDDYGDQVWFYKTKLTTLNPVEKNQQEE